MNATNTKQFDPTTKAIYKKVFGKNRDEGFKKFQAILKGQRGLEIDTTDLIGVTYYGIENVRYIDSYKIYYVIFAAMALMGMAGGDFIFVPGLALIFLADILFVRRMAIGYMGYIYYTENYYYVENGLKKNCCGAIDDITQVVETKKSTILKNPNGDYTIKKTKLSGLGLFTAFLRERRPDLF